MPHILKARRISPDETELYFELETRKDRIKVEIDTVNDAELSGFIRGFIMGTRVMNTTRGAFSDSVEIDGVMVEFYIPSVVIRA